MSKKLKVTQIRSTIGSLKAQKKTVRALGLRKINKVVIHDDTPCIRGMVNSVKHLVKVEDIVGE
ncbi:MAG: 50S ribosomal protein L30 [Chitinispirillaceae bacterium]|nr:50S ribosomal protein L30 [Chitinispirillaceae bacterium]